MSEARCERDKGAGMMAAVDAAHMALKLAEDNGDNEVVEGRVNGLDEAEEDHMDVVDMMVVALGVEVEAEEEKHKCQEVWEEVPEDLGEDHHTKVEDMD
jgi:hypothetical protein